MWRARPILGYLAPSIVGLLSTKFGLVSSIVFVEARPNLGRESTNFELASAKVALVSTNLVLASTMGRFQPVSDLFRGVFSPLSCSPLAHGRRISQAWSAIHARGACLTSKCFSLGTRSAGDATPHVCWLWVLVLVPESQDQEQSGRDRQAHDPQYHGPSTT